MCSLYCYLIVKYKLIFIILFIIFGLLLVFVASHLGFVLFDSQCETGGCSGQLCSSASVLKGMMTTCEWKPEYRCNTDCAVRNFRCSFDSEFRPLCIDCIQECRNQIDLYSGNASNYREFESCTIRCSER